MSAHTSQYERVKPPNDTVTITISREILEVVITDLPDYGWDSPMDNFLQACRAALDLMDGRADTRSTDQQETE